MTSAIQNELFDSLRLELRRGCLILAVLAQLRVEHYGYTLRKALADEGLAIEESTLYPLLRRLEAQGVLSSEWRTDSGAPRRYYALSAEGRRLFKKLTAVWQGLNEAMERLLTEGGRDAT